LDDSVPPAEGAPLLDERLFEGYNLHVSQSVPSATSMASSSEVATASVETRTIQKIRIRLLPFIFFLYIVCFLDRTNIGFAALTMNKDLGITSQQFGLVAGIFFFGYCFFQEPY
jgi:ACS family tartrate transporter-like MFS transporter